MFHAREMGLEEHVPDERFLILYIRQHGSAKEILGPAAVYDPECL